MDKNLHIQIKRDLVLEKEAQIEEFKKDIKKEYEDKANLLSTNSSVITKEIENIERHINRSFEAKAKLEAEVKVLKNAILDLVLYTPEVK